jgi:hypothetical protein
VSPESSPEVPPPSSVPASPPPHSPLDGEKHVSALGSQQHTFAPLQPPLQSESVWQDAAAWPPPLELPPPLLEFVPPLLLLPLPPPLELPPELLFSPASFPLVAASKGLELGVDDPHAISARAPKHIEIRSDRSSIGAPSWRAV